MITAGEGKYAVWLKEKQIGTDRVYLVGGGEKPHIGGVVICEPDNPPQIIGLEGHRDVVILTPIAQRACEKYGTTVVVVGGVHIENAKKEEIEKVVKNCRSMVSCI
jgi:hypothetical protein